MKGDLQGCRCLLYYGANINDTNLLLDLTKLGIHNHKYISILTFLLDLGMNPNLAHTQTGETALMIATTSSHYTLIKLLLEHGADVALFNNEGKNVYDIKPKWEHLHLSIMALFNQYIEKNRQLATKPLLK